MSPTLTGLGRPERTYARRVSSVQRETVAPDGRTVGSDRAAVEAIWAAGDEVVVSFGGWSGTKLGNSCKTVAALTAAHEKHKSEHGG